MHRLKNDQEEKERSYRRLGVLVLDIPLFIVIGTPQGPATIKLDVKFVLACSRAIDVDAVRVVRVA